MDIETADRFLEDRVLGGAQNERFAQAPASSDAFHVARPRGVRLDTVFRLDETRTLCNDWVVRYHNPIASFNSNARAATLPLANTVQVYEDARAGSRYDTVIA